MEFEIPEKSSRHGNFASRGSRYDTISLNKLGRLMRMQSVAYLFSVITLSLATFATAQDPLDEMYGRAVHSYFRGDSMHAQELLNEVIAAGSQDPRAYYFRGLCQSQGGYEAGAVDFERGAQLEIEGKKVVNVGKALERIQGPARIEIEKARSKARLASRARLLELQRTRYEEMQRGGNAGGGIVVPPRVGDPAPAPNALAPNDPFNAGMTKGDPKVVKPTEPNDVPAGDDFGTDPVPDDAMPTPDPGADDDPFK
jgi:hypothetical protein